MAVILEPTRELAIQVADQIDKFSNLRCCVFFGGGSKKAGHNSKCFKLLIHLACLCVVYDLRVNKPHIIVATPGRLIDLLMNYDLDISSS